MSLSLTYNEESNFNDKIYNFDWSSTSLGPMDSWDPAYKTAINLCLQSTFPICIYLGSDWVILHNKEWIQLIGYPYVLGKTIKEAWPSLYYFISSLCESVRTTRKGLFRSDEYIEVKRDGYSEEAYFDYTYSPIFKSDGTFGGIFCIAQETTKRVLNDRRLKTFIEIGNRIPEVESLESACYTMTKVLNDNNTDIPYSLIYFIEHELNDSSKSLIARLIATTFDDNNKKGRHIPDYFPETREIIDLTKDDDKSYGTYIDLKRITATYSFLKCKSWPIYLAIKKGHVKVLLKDESQAVLLSTKISLYGGKVLFAVLICGVNRCCPLDEKYMKYFQQVINQMNKYLLHGMSMEEKKKRNKILADLNRQKVTFFQGISHELKTPLTLMLSPLDDVINVCSQETQETQIMSYLQIIRRNARRLLKLINSSLQFSNIEADQLEAHYCETNIAEFTRELVLEFEDVAKQLGLDYVIEIPRSKEFNRALSDKIYLDHDMYETIVFNLCSNALKHTWNGRITIRLYLDYKDEKRIIVLEVSDTGVGIPETALPNIFQRFYRVESQESRSHEGTGIGLSLVKELITRHGGDITVTSAVNQGTTFKCLFPIGCEHLPKNQIRFNNVENPVTHGRELYTSRQLYLEESSQWIKNSKSEARDDLDQLPIDDRNMDIDKMLTEEIMRHFYTNGHDDEKKYQILLVDDNNDMRDYLEDLLKEFDIVHARDGREAILVLKKLEILPDLVISDIMMPNMNGYELLDVIRSNIKTRLIPVILLSAKASEESKIKGLDKGADDYLIKPFSSRELITRIRANIKLSLLRRKILIQLCKQEESKQLLLSITNMIVSRSDINETFLYVAKEIHRILPCERILIISDDKSKSNKIVTLCEYPENISRNTTMMTSQLTEIRNNDKSKSQAFIKLNEYLNNSPGINISLNVYCDDVHKNVSILSVEVRLDNDIWGWIKVHRSPNSIWFESEVELLQQISNQINLAITYVNLLEENAAKEIQIKATEIANITKSQILANTSHELRTPLNAITGLLSLFEGTNLNTDQKDMFSIMSRASDVILSIVNDILDVAKLEAQKLTLVNRIFDLIELIEGIIETFGKKAGDKKIELILNYDIDILPRYVKSDPERLKQVLSHLLSNAVKFTNKGEIILTVSMQSQEVFEIELCDTGIGIDPEYIQHAWKSFTQGDTSIIRNQDGTGIGLSICKNLVELNGGKIKVKSQLGKGSKFWFTWNVESLSKNFSLETQFNEHVLSHVLRQKRILIIHPIEGVRNTMLKYLKKFEKVDAFDTVDKGISAAKSYKELNDRPAYDLVFIGLYEDNEEEVIKTALELRGLKMNSNDLVIIFIVFQSNEKIELAEKLIEKIGGTTSILYTPITWKKLINQFVHMEKNKNNKRSYIYTNTLKRIADYEPYKARHTNQNVCEDITGRDSKSRARNITRSKCILCVVCFVFFY
ncbi:hypothetical protein C2G38_538757 [Gigaspora rosea]|uniref:histidine kinase n=1 Tax=Gigaspora rosea TaxID=44941 RepID=A0A397UBK1_9GLOM|nr:hypothetical protein C2G38_538757 [Gigaspora rosea]